MPQTIARGISRLILDRFAATDSDVTTSAARASGGDIAIRAGDIRLFGDSDIRTDSAEDGGNITLDADRLIANSCIARTETGGTFLITGAGGLPPRPGVAPLSPYPTGDVRTGGEESASWQPGEAIVEPQGLYELPDGHSVISRECD